MRLAILQLWLTLIALIVFAGCESSSDDYFFENPTSLSVLKNVLCTDGDVSYIGFVTDNTSDYGARLMKISGCALKIDKDFDDDIDGKTGLYVGGTGVSNDSVEIDGEVFIAVASSGYTEFEHWKDKDESKKFEAHKGRVVFRKLGRDLSHDPKFNKSILLGFYPSKVKAFGKKGFFVTGSSFGKNYAGFIDLEGRSVIKEITFNPGDISTAGEKAYISDADTGSVYSVDESVNTVLIEDSLPDPSVRSRGMNSIRGDRIAVFNGGAVVIYNSDLKPVRRVDLPEGYQVSSVSSAEYQVSYEYRKFTNDEMDEQISIYKKEIENNDADQEGSDEDIAVAGDDNEAGDDDSSIPVTIYDAKDGDVVWISTTTGTVMAYDLKNESWLVTYYTDEEEDSVPEYNSEMRPYVSSTYSSFPKYGKTDADNIPYIREIYAKRGLSSTVIYRFTYEGAFEGSYSEKGVLNDDGTVLKDISADFSEILIDPETDSVILLNRNGTSECPLPWNENIIMDITEIISSYELGVDIEKYQDQIGECFGDRLTYVVFPGSMYSVSKEMNSDRSSAGRAVEHPSDYSGTEPSFSDGTVSVSILRTLDDVITEKETSFYIKISPGVPFVGFNSSDIMEGMFNAFPGRLLMFSPFTRRIVEYDYVNRDTVEVYK